MRVQDRSVLERERDNARTQLRTQLANHATGVFVALNAGGLAAALTWLQSLPIDAAFYSCNGLLLRTVPWAAALLIGGVISTAVSYLIRYHSPDPGKVQRGWMIALGVSAGTLITAGVLVSYTVLNCRQISVDQQRWASVTSRFNLARLTGESEQSVLDESARESDKSRRELEYVIAVASLDERIEEEKKIAKLKELRAETTKRIDAYPADKVPSELTADLQRINDLEKDIQAELDK